MTHTILPAPFAADPDRLEAVHERVAALIDCRADACRDAEDADVPS